MDDELLNGINSSIKNKALPENLFLYLLMLIFSDNNYLERVTNMAYDKTIRETFEEKIRERLADPNITLTDMETLARTYSELSKNDWMKEMWSRTAGLGIATGHTPPDNFKGPTCHCSGDACDI